VVLASDASVLRLALVVAVASGCAFEVRAIRVGDVADTDVPIAPLDTLVDVAEAAVDASVDGAALPDADAMAGIDADDAPLPPDFADGSVPDVGVEVTVDLGVDAPSCARPRALCGGSCVDVRASERHCGACDHACPLGDSCGWALHAARSARRQRSGGMHRGLRVLPDGHHRGVHPRLRRQRAAGHGAVDVRRPQRDLPHLRHRP
jgi:hypothetical protein